MKRKFIWLTLVLLLSAEAATAQTEMQVSLTRATAAPFPTSAMAYYNNPMNYFNLTITPVDGRAHDVFICMTLSSDATTTRIWTDERHSGNLPKINIPSMGKRIGSVEFVQHFNRRLNTNLSESYRGVSDLTLPEGTYHLCIDVHDYYDTARVIGSSCMDFNICYSGLAPEFTSPHLTSSTNGYDKLVPAKKTNFAWTGVVSNCFEPNAFDYIIQFVEVYPGQNVQEAVNSNPVLTALDCGRRTFFTYDYKTNPYLRLDSGGVYAVTVTAVPHDPSRTVNLSNDGVSQYMVFTWCGPNTSGLGGTSQSTGGGGSGSTTGNGDGVSDTRMSMRDNQSAVLRTLVKPNIIQPRPFSTIDNTNAPMSVVATPVSGDSVSSSDYVVSLYEYMGDTSVSMSRQPLKQAVLTGVTAHNGNPIEMVSDWSDGLVRGMQYLVSVNANTAYRYNNTYRIRRVDFIDNFPEINHYDSVVAKTGHTDLSSVVLFKWGSADNDYNVLSAAEILTVGRTAAGSETLRVNKSTLNEVAWKASLFDGNSSDLIVYDVYISDEDGWTLFERTGISETRTSLDSVAGKFTAGHTYSVVVRSRMYYDSVGTENSVESRPVKFTVTSSSNTSSYNDASMPLFRLKNGMLYDDYETAPALRGRTAAAPDSVAINISTGGSDPKGNPRKTSLYRGFKSDRLINNANGDVSKSSKVSVAAQLDIFSVEGELAQLPSGGWGGPVKVTLMDGVTTTMTVGVGTATDNNGQPYDWWYLYGGGKTVGTATAGALKAEAFGGVFAHNMSLDDAAWLDKPAKELATASYGKLRFTPRNNSWVAKGGLQMALENKKVLNSYGCLSLATENGHFSRIYIDMGTERLSTDNPLMDSECQKIFTYEVTSDCHLLRLVQLPAGVRASFDYTGSTAGGKTANIGFSTTATAKLPSQSSIGIAMYIETWRNGGSAQWSAHIGGKPGTMATVGSQAELHNPNQTYGSRALPDDYKMDKGLTALLPSAAKSQSLVATAATAAKIAMANPEQSKGLSQQEASLEAVIDSKGNGQSTVEATVCGQLGTAVDFEGWHGSAALAQAVYPADATLNDNYGIEQLKPHTSLPLSTPQHDKGYAFFNDIHFSGHNETTGNVSPFATCLFSTSAPVTHAPKGMSATVRDILVAMPMGAVRRFCMLLSDDDPQAPSKYVCNDENGQIEAHRQAVESDVRDNSLTLKAVMYEKRRGTDNPDDRAVDLGTGSEALAMKAYATDWGHPLCNGTPQQVSVDTTLLFRTDNAPSALSDQVLFTWPYNGDPFVPNGELDSACYIFMKHERDDLFEPSLLKREGKVLRTFAVNQELGAASAADCL